MKPFVAQEGARAHAVPARPRALLRRRQFWLALVSAPYLAAAGTGVALAGDELEQQSSVSEVEQFSDLIRKLEVRCARQAGSRAARPCVRYQSSFCFHNGAAGYRTQRELAELWI
jgi:hypothetical protein